MGIFFGSVWAHTGPCGPGPAYDHTEATFAKTPCNSSRNWTSEMIAKQASSYMPLPGLANYLSSKRSPEMIAYYHDPHILHIGPLQTCLHLVSIFLSEQSARCRFGPDHRSRLVEQSEKWTLPLCIPHRRFASCGYHCKYISTPTRVDI